MNIFERIIAGLIERAWGNKVTSLIGVLVMLAAGLGGAGKAASAEMVIHGIHVQAALLTLAAFVGGVALLLAKDAGVKIDQGQISAVGKKTLVLVAFALCAIAAHAQSAPAQLQQIYAGGISYSVNATPAIAGTGLYAHAINSSGTYAFTAVDALPNTVKPFTVSTNLGAGVAQKVYTFGTIPIYMPTAAGISWTGKNAGWQWSGGAMASIHVKGQYYVMPSVRFLKSSVSNGSGYQPILGVMVGWGK